MRFSYHLPINIIFGTGEIARIGEQAALWSKRALIVTGKSSAKTGLLARSLEYLRKSGVSSVVFDRVTSNPLTTAAIEGATLAREEKCGAVVGIGGGSILDAAKGIAFLAGNSGDINEYIFGKQPTGIALPLILVPTTCGTGSEGNSFAVFTNPETKDKKSLRSPQIIAKASIIDPSLMITMPRNILAAVGLDAFCHNMEAYLSQNSQPLTDYMALEGMRLITECLPRLHQGGCDISDWEKMAWASTLGGIVINTAGVVACHAMEHPVSGFSDAVHGQGLAALTPFVLEATISPEASNRMEMVSAMLGGASAGDCPDAFRRFSKGLGLEFTLSDFGITKESIDWLVENCVRVSSASLAAHPVELSSQRIREIYEAAL